MNKKGKKPKYQNQKEFKIIYQQHKIDLQENTPKHMLCKRCWDIVEWKLKFGKYKKLTQPGKCQECQGRFVVHAYRNICDACGKRLNKCTKCGEQNQIVEKQDKNLEKQLQNDKFIKMQNLMKKYRECTKRKIQRLLEQNKVDFNGETFIYKETQLEVSNIQFKKMYKEEEGDDEESEGEEFDLSDESGSYKAHN